MSLLTHLPTPQVSMDAITDLVLQDGEEELVREDVALLVHEEDTVLPRHVPQQVPRALQVAQSHDLGWMGWEGR